MSESALAAAADYQRRATLFPGWREKLVAALAPRRGDTVIDVCCGPGLNLAALHAAVGPEGTIIAIEQSPQLLTLAAARITRRRWDNVELINAPVETVELSVRADAALFAAAHEVLTAPAALSNIFRHLRPGAGAAAGGWQMPAKRLWPLRALVAVLHNPYLTGLDQPWRLLTQYVPGLHISEIGFGTGYLAHTTPAPLPLASTTAPTPPGSITPLDNPESLPATMAASLREGRRVPADRCAWFSEQVRGVLDPLAQSCNGLAVTDIRPLLARAWREEFGTRLDEPALSDCASALAEDRPWIHTLWYDSWW